MSRSRSIEEICTALVSCWCGLSPEHAAAHRRAFEPGGLAAALGLVGTVEIPFLRASEHYSAIGMPVRTPVPG